MLFRSGLDIVKKIVERHNGKIFFESKINEGTVFFVQLPFVFPKSDVEVVADFS